LSSKARFSVPNLSTFAITELDLPNKRFSGSPMRNYLESYSLLVIKSASAGLTVVRDAQLVSALGSGRYKMSSLSIGISLLAESFANLNNMRIAQILAV
jgi:hypothetical protein